jgi:hypothetical protein
MIGTHLA